MLLHHADVLVHDLLLVLQLRWRELGRREAGGSRVVRRWSVGKLLWMQHAVAIRGRQVAAWVVGVGLLVEVRVGEGVAALTLVAAGGLGRWGLKLLHVLLVVKVTISVSLVKCPLLLQLILDGLLLRRWQRLVGRSLVWKLMLCLILAIGGGWLGWVDAAIFAWNSVHLNLILIFND